MSMPTPVLSNERLERSREVEAVVVGSPTSDGAGVRLVRVLTQDLQRRLDPFLMLDAFRSDDPNDYIAGFPAHPHRGFETITYMLAGRMRHRDSTGAEGLLESGAVQWMTAARGIVHSEMPEQEKGLMEGFQLWLNLAAKDKMRRADYRDIPSAQIPEFTTESGVRVHVIAGRSHGTAGAVERPLTEPLILDVHLPAASEYGQTIPVGHNSFIYVYRGDVLVGASARQVSERSMAVLENNRQADGARFIAPRGARALLVAGRPLGEPIAQYGPFVMNTREEIEQAIADYQSGHFGA